MEKYFVKSVGTLPGHLIQQDTSDILLRCPATFMNRSQRNFVLMNEFPLSTSSFSVRRL